MKCLHVEGQLKESVARDIVLVSFVMSFTSGSVSSLTLELWESLTACERLIPDDDLYRLYQARSDAKTAQSLFATAQIVNLCASKLLESYDRRRILYVPVWELSPFCDAKSPDKVTAGALGRAIHRVFGSELDDVMCFMIGVCKGHHFHLLGVSNPRADFSGDHGRVNPATWRADGLSCSVDAHDMLQLKMFTNAWRAARGMPPVVFDNCVLTVPLQSDDFSCGYHTLTNVDFIAHEIIEKKRLPKRTGEHKILMAPIC